MWHNLREITPQEKELKNTALAEAQSCRAQLVVKQPFIGMLAMRMELVTVIGNSMPTAATDGSRIFFNAAFLMSLTPGQRVFLMAHEVWHCVLMHFQRKGSRDHEKFNYATDLEVNFMLQQQGFENLPLLPHKKEWIGLSAEEIYERLNMPAQRPKDADVHIFDGLPDLQGVHDPDYTPFIAPHTGRNWRKWVVAAAQQVSRKQGSLPAALEAFIKAAYQPHLCWKDILQQFVSSAFGGQRQWLPPNRRYMHSGLYLPSRREDKISLVLAIDTSGSTTCFLPQFLAELQGIINAFGRYEITVIECDTTIQNISTFNEQTPLDLQDISMHGFGGTDFRPVFRYIDDHITDPGLLIFMTDGYGPAPATPPQYPVLWVITPNDSPPVEWGWKTWLD